MPLAKNNECCGCGLCSFACKKSAIQMIEDEDGFVTPIIDEKKCVNCGLCSRLCPVLNPNRIESFLQKVYICKSKSNEILYGSSSGGAFYSLAKYVIANGGSVYGAAWTEQLTVSHIRVSSVDDIKLIMKSKYVQSDISSSFSMIEKDLSNGLLVLFSGTPCQVSAIKKVFGKYKNLLLVDIVCHGVPNARFFKDYCRFFEEKKHGKITQYCFREKNSILGNYATCVTTERKKYIKTWRDLSYSYLFMNGYISRESCYNCKYACKDRVGDITLGDFWGAHIFHPDFDTKGGASLLMINNENGLTFFDKIRNDLLTEQSSYENAAKNNPQIAHPSDRPEGRDDVFDEWRRNGYSAVYSIYRKNVKFSWKDMLKGVIVFLQKNWSKK